jgi:hypothetical protein
LRQQEQKKTKVGNRGREQGRQRGQGRENKRRQRRGGVEGRARGGNTGRGNQEEVTRGEDCLQVRRQQWKGRESEEEVLLRIGLHGCGAGDKV